MICCTCLQRPIGRFLIDKGAEFNNTRVTYITSNPEEQNPYNLTNGTVLSLAAYNNHTSTVQLLLEKGIDPLGSTNDLYSALHFGAMNANTGIIKLMLDRGIDPALRTRDGSPPLLVATSNTVSPPETRLATVRYLLDRGASPNSATYERVTPLMRAAFYGYTDIVTLLLERGADINARSNSGQTALLNASKNNFTDLANFLLDHGANP